jgi:hypothetical protein
LVLAGPTTARDVFVEGRQVVRDGHLVTINMSSVVARQTALAQTLGARRA